MYPFDIQRISIQADQGTFDEWFGQGLQTTCHHTGGVGTKEESDISLSRRKGTGRKWVHQSQYAMSPFYEILSVEH